ncbi:MAG: hypothetical protein K2I23_06945 [Clostridia bacterium]|nr:hypothetical protein [Clostridia bacterium]
MKKFLSVALVLAIALTMCLGFVACSGQNVDKLTDIKYETILADYLEYPDAANLASMNAISRNVAEILADESLSTADRIAAAMYRSTYNEIDCEYFAYFIDRSGETKMNSNHGQLIYQRLRRQSDSVKDDWTLKLPINHNFDLIAQNTLTTAAIRYVKDGKYYRMSNNSDIVYNTETGLLEVEQWKKESNKNWNRDEDAKSSRSYKEARKTCINWKIEGIVKSEGAKIESKADDNGNKYFELTFSIDVDKANADNAAYDEKKDENSTIGMLENDNGGKNMTYEYCNLVVQIWDCGLAKQYSVSESWKGTIVAYSGSAQCESTIVFSYSMADQNDSVAASIKAGIK